MKCGVFGGTFDPVHLGHLILAETCREACGLDQVRFVPAFQSPFKTETLPTPGKQRLAMVEFATAGIPEFVVDPREVKASRVCYTVETLQSLAEEFSSAELYLLLGWDSLHDLPAWKEPETIVELARIVAVNRGQLSEAARQQTLSQLPANIRDRVQVVEMPAIEISARHIRSLRRAGKSIRFLTPRPVERYIVEQRLYEA